MRKLVVAALIAAVAGAGTVAGAVMAQTRVGPYQLVVRAERLLFGRDLTVNTTYALKDALYRTRPAARIVFIGDSHAELGNWSQLLRRVDVSNRGIAGEASDQLLQRIEGANLAGSEVVVITGTNDVHLREPQETLSNIEGVLAKIGDPKRVVLVSTPLTTDPERNEFNRALHVGQREICVRLGCTYADINTAIAAGGSLRPEFNVDGLHLSNQGYEAVAEVLRPLLPLPDGSSGT